MTDLAKRFVIGEMVYRKWRYLDRQDFWYEPFFVQKVTPTFVFVAALFEEHLPHIRLDRGRLERSGQVVSHAHQAVFYAQLPEEYLKTTIGYLMNTEPRAVLGLSDKFTPEELKDAYRKAVREAHPDAGGSHDKFIQIQAAYERLAHA